jgi:hypothetical protein
MRRQFMKLPELEEFRLQREDFSVELRKKQRSDEAIKRRGKHPIDVEDWELAVKRLVPLYDLEMPLAAVVLALKAQLTSAPGLTELQKTLKAVSLLISEPVQAPIKEVVEAGLVPEMVKILDLTQFPAEVAVRCR